MDQVIQLLNAILSPDTKIRTQAEQALSQFQLNSSFTVMLAQITLNTQLPEHIRQLSGVLLKRHIKTNWCEKHPQTGEPIILDSDKEIIRKNIPQGLYDKSTKIITAIVCI